jgi:hypothetical protein
MYQKTSPPFAFLYGKIPFLFFFPHKTSIYIIYIYIFKKNNNKKEKEKDKKNREIELREEKKAYKTNISCSKTFFIK